MEEVANLVVQFYPKAPLPEAGACSLLDRTLKFYLGDNEQIIIDSRLVRERIFDFVDWVGGDEGLFGFGGDNLEVDVVLSSEE